MRAVPVVITSRTEPSSHPKIDATTAARLGRGCFVKVALTGATYWIEIVEVSNNTIRGVIRQFGEALEPATSMYAVGTTAAFPPSEVLETGCDRYCWC